MTHDPTVRATNVAEQWRRDFGPHTEQETSDRDQRAHWHAALHQRRQDRLRDNPDELRGLATAARHDARTRLRALERAPRRRDGKLRDPSLLTRASMAPALLEQADHLDELAAEFTGPLLSGPGSTRDTLASTVQAAVTHLAARRDHGPPPRVTARPAHTARPTAARTLTRTLTAAPGAPGPARTGKPHASRV